MPLKNYGVLKGRVLAGRAERVDDTPHYQVHVEAGGTHFRVAVNVQSVETPPELLFLVDENFQHPVTAGLTNLPVGFRELERRPGGLALDFIRFNLFDRMQMRTLPANLPEPDNDLNDKLEHYVGRAAGNPNATVYAFGERWGPEQGKKDKVFNFQPGNGVHDIHMNQGNVARFKDQDGVWQDGALLIHLAPEDRWIGIFAAFQSQAWHTDDTTGHRLLSIPTPGPGPQPSPEEPDFVVQIVAALANPIGPAPEQETVLLLNTSPAPLDVTGWAIADRQKNKHFLSGTIAAGGTLSVLLPQTVQLGNKGGVITLLNRDNLKVHGVSYTKEQASREGWTIVF